MTDQTAEVASKTPPDTDAEELYPTPAYAWYMVILLLVTYTFSFIDRQILGLLGHAIKQDFGISDTQFGLLTGFSFALFYTVFGLLCARIADSRSRRGLIAVGLLIWSLMTAMSALAHNFLQLFLMRMGVGAGEAALAPAANSLLGDAFPKKRLSTALSVYSMGVPIGSSLAFIVGGKVIELASELPDITVPGFGLMSGWQKTFLMVGLPGVILTFFIIALKEPTRKGMSGVAKSLPLKEVYAFVKMRFRALAGICLGVSIGAALSYSSIMFMALFFHRFHNIGPAEVGVTFGSLSLISGPLGLLFGGWLADRLYQEGRKDAHMIALMVAPICYGIPAIIYPLISDVSTIWGLLFFMTIFTNLPGGIAFASIQMITPNQMRGQIISLYVLCTSIIGYGMGPFLVGLFTDYLFKDEMMLNYALILVAATAAPLSLGFFIWGRKAFAEAVVAEEGRIALGNKTKA